MKTKFLIYIILLTSLLFGFDYSKVYKVATVIDGDTFDIAGGERIRLIGIDTPETVDPRKPVEYFGKEASEYTKKHLTGKMVRLEYDQTSGERGKYSRLLAYVWVQTDSGEVLFNEQIIKDGYAFAYVKYPFRDSLMEQFRQAEKYARENELGLWSPDSVAFDVTKTIPDAEYIGNKSSKVVHKRDCEWVQKMSEGNMVGFTSLTSAQTSGYRACRVCMPEVYQAGADTEECEYWLNTSSNTRHNRTCKWFKNTKKGRCCGSGEGKACKGCGG